MYFIDTGLLLIVGPWTMWWQRNFFAQFVPWLPMLLASAWVRIGVAVVGVITLAAGLTDARRLIWPSSRIDR